jgi:hypothetical protein
MNHKIVEREVVQDLHRNCDGHQREQAGVRSYKFRDHDSENDHQAVGEHCNDAEVGVPFVERLSEPKDFGNGYREEIDPHNCRRDVEQLHLYYLGSLEFLGLLEF